jgi:hypothetical protein
MAAYTRAIKDVQREIDELSRVPWWKPWKSELDQSEKDRIIVLKAEEKRLRRHREGLGVRKGK